MAGAEGIEPSYHGIKTRCLTTWLRPIKEIILTCPSKIARVKGLLVEVILVGHLAGEGLVAFDRHFFPEAALSFR